MWGSLGGRSSCQHRNYGQSWRWRCPQGNWALALERSGTAQLDVFNLGDQLPTGHDLEFFPMVTSVSEHWRTIQLNKMPPSISECLSSSTPALKNIELWGSKQLSLGEGPSFQRLGQYYYI